MEDVKRKLERAIEWPIRKISRNIAQKRILQ